MTFLYKHFPLFPRPLVLSVTGQGLTLPLAGCVDSMSPLSVCKPRPSLDSPPVVTLGLLQGSLSMCYILTTARTYNV